MIAVDHFTKRYGTVAAVDSLGFEVRAAERSGHREESGGVSRQVWHQ